MKEEFNNFNAFYKYYLSQHQNKNNRLFHVIGTTISIAIFITVLFHRTFELLILIPILGYGFAWLGHFLFERNKPATFINPLWSLKADFKLFYDILTGNEPLNPKK